MFFSILNKTRTVFSEKTGVSSYGCDPKTLDQCHQNEISCLPCPNDITTYIQLELDHWFKKYCANKKVSQNFHFFYCCDLNNAVNVIKIALMLCYVPIIYPWKFGKNRSLVHKILSRQEMPTPTESASKTICPPPRRWVDVIMVWVYALRVDQAILMSTHNIHFHDKKTNP